MMKKLKNSFTLLVALTTVGITLMSSTTVFKKKLSTFGTARCFKSDLTVKYNCGSSEIPLTTDLQCTYARDYDQGAHVFSINQNDYVENDEIAITCYGDESFCCATLIPDETWSGYNFEGPCAGQPYFTLEGINDQWEIFQVYCKFD